MTAPQELQSYRNQVVLVFAINATGIYRHGKPPIPAVGVFLPAIAGLALSVHTEGVPGILWAFPGVVLFNFIFDRRLANLMSGTARAVVTLPLVIVFANIFSRIITRLQRQLEEQATVDPLTGTLNRRQLEIFARHYRGVTLSFGAAEFVPGRNRVEIA